MGSLGISSAPVLHLGGVSGRGGVGSFLPGGLVPTPPASQALRMLLARACMWLPLVKSDIPLVLPETMPVPL